MFEGGGHISMDREDRNKDDNIHNSEKEIRNMKLKCFSSNKFYFSCDNSVPYRRRNRLFLFLPIIQYVYLNSVIVYEVVSKLYLQII